MNRIYDLRFTIYDLNLKSKIVNRKSKINQQINMKDFILQLISNVYTQRISSTRFAYFATIILVIILILSCCFAIIFESLKADKIAFDYFTGIAEVILSAAALVICAGIPKTMSDRFQKNKVNRKSKIVNLKS